MTEEEAREIVERYEGLLARVAGHSALDCDLPLYFDGAGNVLVSQTERMTWPCVRIVRSVREVFAKG